MALYYNNLQSPISFPAKTLKLQNAVFDEVMISTDVNFDYEYSEHTAQVHYVPSFLTHEQMISDSNLIEKYSIPSSNAFASSTVIPNAWMPYEAFDLGFDTQWGSDIPSENGEYIGIDLGENRVVNELAIAWSESPDDNLIYHFANSVQIQISKDGLEWIGLPTTYGQIQQGNNYGTRYMLNTPVETRYIRAFFTEPNNISGYRIREIAIIEDSSVFGGLCPKYSCGEYIEITDYPDTLEEYLSYCLFDENYSLIIKAPIHKGEIDLMNASYISFDLSEQINDLSSADIKFKTGKTNISYFSDTWSTSTKLHAKFQNSIVAGGLAYDMNNDNRNCGFFIKRRAVPDLLWTTVGYINSQDLILDGDLLNGSFIDRTAFPNEDYEYIVISVFNGEELQSSSPSTAVHCWTDGIAVSEIDKTYYTLLEANINNITQNKGAALVEPFNGKFPFAFKNGMLNYITGSAQGLFAPLDNDYCHYMFDNEKHKNATWKYREEFREWLCNGKPKILKYFDGRTYLISINDTVSDDDGEHNFKNITTFNFTQIGNADSTKDLIESGLMNEY